MLNTNVSLSSFFFSFFLLSFFSFLFFILFFLLLEKVSKSTRSFTVDETNLSSLFLSFSEYIYNFQYLGRVEGKTVLRCTYLFRRVYFLSSFILRTSDSSPESAGSAFLQRFCSMLFTGHSPGAAVNQRLYPSTSVLKTKDPLPNFLWRKGTIFGAKGSSQSFGSFSPHLYFIRATTMTYIPFSVQLIIGHGVWVIWLSFISPF